MKKLGLWEQVRPCNQDVRYGNGVVEPMKGVITLPVKIQGKDMPMRAYVLQGKGPGLIMGFTFLEDNELLVDCAGRVLSTRGKGETVRCCRCQVAAAPGRGRNFIPHNSQISSQCP